MSVSIMSLVSASPLSRSTVRIGGALTWGKERNFKFRVGPVGLDVDCTTRTGFDLDLAAAAPIDLGGQIPPQLAEQIVAAGGNVSGFIVIDPQPHEAEQVARAIATATPAGFGPAMPILNPYQPRNGLLVPVATIANQLTPHPLAKENKTMPHFLERAAPDAFRLIKQIVDDPSNIIAEVILFEFTRRQGVCKRLDHIKGSVPRDKTLTEAEIDALAKPFAAEMGRRKVSDMREPLINPLPDAPFGLVPLLDQRDDANVVFFAAFVGTDGARLALDIDEVLPGVSDAVLEGLARKPKNDAA
jgi:hypothetical protein